MQDGISSLEDKMLANVRETGSSVKRPGRLIIKQAFGYQNREAGYGEHAVSQQNPEVVQNWKTLSSPETERTAAGLDPRRVTRAAIALEPVIRERVRFKYGYGWLAKTYDSFKEALAEVSIGLKRKLAKVWAGVKWLKDSIFGAVGDWLRWFNCLVGFIASLVAVSILALAIGLVDKQFARWLWRCGEKAHGRSLEFYCS